MRIPLKAIVVLKRYAVVVSVCGLVSLPVLSFGQDEPTSSRTPSAGSGGSSIWGNSAASGIGATSIVPSASSASSQREELVSAGVIPGVSPSDPRNGTTTGTIRLRTGPTTDGRDPGGNPDVPFDSNMNLCFLVAGVLFSVWVIRKKNLLKPAVSN